MSRGIDVARATPPEFQPLPVRGIDHVVIRTQRLDDAQRTFRRLGFTLTPRGVHVGRGSANHTAAFAAGGYLELIDYGTGDTPAAFASRSEGPVAVAFDPVDSDELHRRLVGLGHDIEPPRDLARPVATAEGEKLARFRNVGLPDPGLAALRYFACHQLTRTLVWREGYLEHPNGVTALSGLVVVAAEPSRLAPSHIALFGPDSVVSDPEKLFVSVGRQTIEVLAPAAFARLYPSVAVPTDLSEGWFAGVRLAVTSRPRTLQFLKGEGFRPERNPDGTITILPEEAGGTLIVFS